MPQAYVAFGGNLGAVERTFCRARALLLAQGLRVTACSALYRSTPWPASAIWQPDYLNAVARLEVGRGAFALLRQLRRIERQLGRRRVGTPNAPRTIDLDLIAFGQLQIRSRRLTLPHPRAHLRSFVLQPLCELAPQVLVGDTLLLPARSWRDRCRTRPSELVWWRQAWDATDDAAPDG